MIAILQLDGVSLPHLNQFLEQGRLPRFPTFVDVASGFRSKLL